MNGRIGHFHKICDQSGSNQLYLASKRPKIKYRREIAIFQADLIDATQLFGDGIDSIVRDRLQLPQSHPNLTLRNFVSHLLLQTHPFHQFL
jgi:hypothetical protein